MITCTTIARRPKPNNHSTCKLNAQAVPQKGSGQDQMVDTIGGEIGRGGAQGAIIYMYMSNYIYIETHIHMYVHAYTYINICKQKST